MDIEIERLKVWMTDNGYNGMALAKKLGISSSLVYKILNGTRPFGPSFLFGFARIVGFDRAMQMFGTVEDEKWGMRTKTDKHLRPQEYAAHKAVAIAILRGQLLPAKVHKCHGCDKQASHYHHSSYDPANHLRVIPLCRKCHSRHHHALRTQSL